MNLKRIIILATVLLSLIFVQTSVTARTDYEDKIHEVLKSLPPFWAQDREEPEDERDDRFKVLSKAVDIATSNPKNRPRNVSKEVMTSALLTIAYKETALAKNVNNGQCDKMPKGQQCDMDADGNPRARTYFQLWEVACPSVHNKDLVPGSQEELNIAAVCASKRLTSAYYRCASKNDNGDWAGAHSGYRSSDCNWEPPDEQHKRYSGPKARAEYMIVIQSKLSRVPVKRDDKVAGTRNVNKYN